MPRSLSIILVLAGLFNYHADCRAEYWTEAMRDVHANFEGRSGTIARLGDSIFISQAYFMPLRSGHQNVTPDVEQALDWIQEYVTDDAWFWQSPQTGSKGATTSSWPLESDVNPPLRNIDHWLESLNPETALIMWGTNDIAGDGTVDEYKANLQEVVRTVKANGTIPILTSIPPRHEFEERAAEYAQAAADLARDEQVPWMDYYGEILLRAPGDSWDGALAFDGDGSVFDVERPISGDGVHPSFPLHLRRDFSGDALSKSGYTLLNYLTLLTTFQVFQEVLALDENAWTGDYNHNGLVDAPDYTVWRDSLGQDGSNLPADASGNGRVGPEDYEIWKENFGELFDGAPSFGTTPARPVPENCSLLPWSPVLAWLMTYRLAFRQRLNSETYRLAG